MNFTDLIINLQLRYVSYQSYNHVILDRLIQQGGCESHRLHRNSINRLIPHKLSRQPFMKPHYAKMHPLPKTEENRLRLIILQLKPIVESWQKIASFKVCLEKGITRTIPQWEVSLGD